MKRLMCLYLSGLVLAAGCMGRQARPIAVIQDKDKAMTSEALKTEIADLQTRRAESLKAAHNVDVQNVVCIIGGALVIVPFFFMDLKGADRTEAAFYQQRIEHLNQLAAEKAAQ